MTDEMDLGMGTAGETLEESAKLLLKVEPGHLMSDAHKWGSRCHAIAAAFLKLAKTKGGTTLARTRISNERANRDPKRDDSALSSKVGKETPVDRDVTPPSQVVVPRSIPADDTDWE